MHLVPFNFVARSPKQTQGPFDAAAANCGGYVPNGNCAGNPYWTMPSGQWWTFPFQDALPRGNPLGIDGYNGWVFNYTDLTSDYLQSPGTLNGPITWTVGRPLGPMERLERYTAYCNCGPNGGQFVANCYNNCNCVCACACDCNCCGTN